MEVDDLKAVVDIPDLGGLLIVPSLDAITLGRSPPIMYGPKSQAKSHGMQRYMRIDMN